MKNFTTRYSRTQMGVRARHTKIDVLNPRFAERVEHFLIKNKKAEALVLLRWGALVDASILRTGKADKFGKQPWQMIQSEPSKFPKRDETMDADIEPIGDIEDLSKIFDARYDEIVDLTLQNEKIKFKEVKVKKEKTYDTMEES